MVWQIRKSYLPAADKDLYTYAYGLLIGQAVNLIIAGLLAMIFHAYVTVLVYLISYIPLRSYAGGHHANTYQVCTLVSTVLLCAACLAAGFVPVGYMVPVSAGSAFISGVLIFLLAPVQDHNKPLDEKEKKRYKKRSRGVWAIETVVMTAFFLFGMETAGFAIALSHITLSVLLGAGIIKNRYLLTRYEV